MAKIDDFKQFVKDKPYLAYKVYSGVTSWQKLFEIYDMYGPSHEVFSSGESRPTQNKQVSEPVKEVKEVKQESTNASTNNDSVTSILKTLQTLNVEKLVDNFNSLKKVFSLFEKKPDKPVDIVKPYKRFQD